MHSVSYGAVLGEGDQKQYSVPGSQAGAQSALTLNKRSHDFPIALMTEAIPLSVFTSALWARSSSSEQLSPSAEQTCSHDQPLVGDSFHPVPARVVVVAGIVVVVVVVVVGVVVVVVVVDVEHQQSLALGL